MFQPRWMWKSLETLMTGGLSVPGGKAWLIVPARSSQSRLSTASLSFSRFRIRSESFQPVSPMNSGWVVGQLQGSFTCVITWPQSEEHTSELQSLMRILYAAFCLKQNIHTLQQT